MAQRIDDLQYKGLKLIQDTDEFCFGCDAVELANFADVKAGSLAADLCSGTGVIAVLTAAKRNARVKAVEINPITSALLAESARLNGLSGQVEAYCMRVQECRAVFGRIFDAVLANPPYRKAGSGYRHGKPTVAYARHELELTLAELIDCATGIVRTGGAFYVVYPTDRLSEMLSACSQRRLEPKVLQILTPAEGKPPHLFLLKCVYGGRPGLKVLPQRTVRAYTEG